MPSESLMVYDPTLGCLKVPRVGSYTIRDSLGMFIWVLVTV